MKTLIFGCGYVGRAVAKHFRKRGFYVGVTTRHQENVESLQEVSDTVCLLEKPQALKSIIQEGQYQAIIFAVGAGRSGSYKATYYDNASLLVDAVKESSSVKQIIYTSSISVYGEQEGKLVDELTHIIPQTENGKILLETEKLLLSAPCRTCIFRLGQITGPKRSLLDVLKRHKGPWSGDGSAKVHLSPLDDIVQGVDFALLKGLKGVYNLCQQLPLTRRELYLQISKKYKLEEPYWDPEAPSFHGGSRLVSSSKIKRAGFIFPTTQLIP